MVPAQSPSVISSPSSFMGWQTVRLQIPRDESASDSRAPSMVKRAEEPLDLPEELRADLLRQAFARPGILWQTSPRVHDGLAASEVELGEWDIEGPLPDGLGKPRNVMAAVDERAIPAPRLVHTGTHDEIFR